MVRDNHSAFVGGFGCLGTKVFNQEFFILQHQVFHGGFVGADPATERFPTGLEDGAFNRLQIAHHLLAENGQQLVDFPQEGIVELNCLALGENILLQVDPGNPKTLLDQQDALPFIREEPAKHLAGALLANILQVVLAFHVADLGFFTNPPGSLETFQFIHQGLAVFRDQRAQFRQEGLRPRQPIVMIFHLPLDGLIQPADFRPLGLFTKQDFFRKILPVGFQLLQVRNAWLALILGCQD